MASYWLLYLAFIIILLAWAVWERSQRRRTPDAAAEPPQEKPLISPAWIIGLACFVLAGVAGVVLYVSQFKPPYGDAVMSVALATGAAAIMLGVVIGFLFGIPRSVQEGGTPGTAALGPDGTAGSPEAGYRANTNLEQISDWLTKILVGVGLTQIGTIGPKLGSLGAEVAPAFGGAPSSSTFAIALMMYFLLVGFLYGYVWARVVVAPAFHSADLEALGRRVVREVKGVLDQQSQTDAQALALLSRQLTPGPGDVPVVEAELVGAIKAASAPVKVHVFQQARAFRKENPANVAATIPIFKALTESAPGRFHRNFAQLAYGLKDQATPDWSEAERNLTEAIRVRGPAERAGYWLYEFNRALCRIHLDPASGGTVPSAPSDKTKVLEDLSVVAQSPGADNLLATKDVAEWMKRNGVKREDLG